ncbi:TetR/AcrR family transcriptional regulator [Sandaracinus amylolyticus]|uniref:TetR/AcrR family transcriptional regulator n=1 Tax=Sandaracinus amylolyticus TaxID=927083 RepID=UPI001F305032|nr:helix-turn-helix domain-containing protein [Sandaracinus amylolyticus]UJR80726.1 Bacterial regulatory protein, tetR family [Sandaracinus amylolyticus]
MTRQRLPPDQARERILDAAEKRLREGGLDAVRVQPIARDLGITDAAIHHHFEGRQGLLEALLRRSGRRLKESLRAIEVADPEVIVERMAQAYDDEGLAELAMWLHHAGWREGGSGMLSALVETVHAARERCGVRVELEDTARAIAWLHLTLATEPLFGGAVLRSVGLSSAKPSRGAQRAWIAEAMRRLLFSAER